MRSSDSTIDIISNTYASAITMVDHLLEQLTGIKLDPHLQHATVFIIKSLDKSGFLRESEKELADLLMTSTTVIKHALGIVQSLEPAGIGARDLKDCLLLQLPEQAINERKILSDYFDLLCNQDISALSKKLECSPADIQTYIDTIRRLNPKPGASFHYEHTAYIIPDILIESKDNQKLIHFTDSLAPIIQINEIYYSLSADSNEKTKKYLDEKYKEIQWLNKGLIHRKQTIVAIMNKILERQQDFFDYGPNFMVPLTMKDIATALTLHESTISRAVKNKYIQTDFGLFEMRYFFKHPLPSNNVTEIKIKALMTDMIQNENKQKPLSDQKITDLLKLENISISRRLITKYREQLKIENSTKRRRY
jgi:RNA polymerase sigma-54 factor